jgi:HK97 family phage major capsid protein
MTIHELLTQKGELVKEARAIEARVHAEHNGDWRPDDEKKFDDLMAQAEKTSGQIERMAKLEAAERSLQDADESKGRRSEPSQPQHDGRRGNPGRALTDRDRGEALRAWMTAGAPTASPTPQQRELALRCGINLDSKAINIQLGPAMRATAPDANGLRTSPEDVRDWQTRFTEERAALTGLQSTTTTGGYTVADEAMRELEIALLAYGGMRSVATVMRTATGGPLPIPTTNDTANKGEIIGENTTSNELEMTFGQLVLDAWKYSSKYILASIEFLQDTSINANAFLGNALGTRIARITNDHFTTGTGSQPNGIVTASTSSAITTAAAQTITYDNLVDVEHSVDPAYRVGGRWMMHDSALKVMKKIKVLQYSGDTTGTPLWVPGLAAGAPDTILGYPYTINQSMAAMGAGTKSVIFGDLSKYIIRDVRDVTVVRLDELFALLGQVAFLALSRHDGDLLNAGTNPVKHLIQGS